MPDISEIIANAKEKGFVTIYSDTDERVAVSVEAYNREMGECRVKRKRINELEMGYVTLNPLLAVCIGAGNAEVVFAKPVLALILLAVFAIGFVIFALAKKNYYAATAFVVPLIFLDPLYAILLAADIVLAVWHALSDGKLKHRQGYPAFMDIQITYDRNPEPK